MRFVVTGTDTSVGKTVFSAALAGASGAHYWKPIQAGLEPLTDSQSVGTLFGLPPEKIIPEAYVLNTPASIHRAAELDNVDIDLEELEPPDVDQLIIEGAGGALVPITRELVLADQFIRWNAPIIIVARTTLGTINHTLLTIESLRARALRIRGVAFVGDPNEDSERTIGEMGRTKRLGRLPMLNPLDAAGLTQAFDANFDLADFR